MNYLLVFLGGGLGASIRHAVNMASAKGLGTAFPYGTFIINITGSTVMGLIAGYLAFKGQASQPWRLFLMTGILGGYTTFSAFSLDTALLYERGELALAALRYLRHRGHQVIVFHLMDPAEVELSGPPEVRFTDPESPASVVVRPR